MVPVGHRSQERKLYREGVDRERKERKRNGEGRGADGGKEADAVEAQKQSWDGAKEV